MTRPNPNLALAKLLGAWRADINSVPFPRMSDLIVEASRVRDKHVPSPECWCEPLATPSRWQHRGPEPHAFEPGPDDFQPGDRDDITPTGTPTAIHQ